MAAKKLNDLIRKPPEKTQLVQAHIDLDLYKEFKAKKQEGVKIKDIIEAAFKLYLKELNEK